MLCIALGNSIPRWESSFIITICSTFAGTRSEIPDEIVFFSKCIPTPKTFNFKFDSGPIFYKPSWSARQNKLIFSWQRWIFLNIHPRLANSPVYFPWPHCIYTVSENISLKKKHRRKCWLYQRSARCKLKLTPTGTLPVLLVGPCYN